MPQLTLNECNQLLADQVKLIRQCRWLVSFKRRTKHSTRAKV